MTTSRVPSSAARRRGATRLPEKAAPGPGPASAHLEGPALHLPREEKTGPATYAFIGPATAASSPPAAASRIKGVELNGSYGIRGSLSLL